MWRRGGGVQDCPARQYSAWQCTEECSARQPTSNLRVLVAKDRIEGVAERRGVQDCPGRHSAVRGTMQCSARHSARGSAVRGSQLQANARYSAMP